MNTLSRIFAGNLRQIFALFAIVLALNILQITTFGSQRIVLGGNEAAHANFLYQLVVKSTIAIEPQAKADRAYFNGRYFSNKPPGLVFFLVVPAYLYAAVGGISSFYNTLEFIKYCNAILSALTVVGIFLYLSTFNLKRTSVIFGVVAGTAGTLYLAYACLAINLPLSIFLCIVALLFYRLFCLQPQQLVFWGIAGFAATYSIIVDYSNGFFLLPLFILAMVDLYKEKRLWIYCLPSLFPIGLLMGYNWCAFHNPFILTYSYYQPVDYVSWNGVAQSLHWRNIPRGLYGFLFSNSRGMFWISPVTLLGGLACLRSFQKREFDLWGVALMAISGILISAAYSLWHGGHCIGYRHTLLAAVILGMLSAFVFDKAGPWRQNICCMILLFSCFTGIMAVPIQYDRELLALSWKEEVSQDTHAAFYSELLFPYFQPRQKR